MLSTRFCPVCGAANNDTQANCFACGQVLSGAGQDGLATPAGLLHGRYRLGTIIGSGGYSAVYRGWDTQESGQAVAIKQITLQGLDTEETIEATNTYNREIEALSTLSHPQVPRLYDHFSDTDHWYLVLEYIEGQTLESYFEEREAQKRPFQIEEVLSIGLQLCQVLRYLHSRQPAVIFRDLKPDNIMRTSAGELYLIDFGIARRYIPGQSRDTQSLGSPGYAAPEQYGRAQTNVRTDLYSLGVLLHQLLSGQDPSDTPRSLPPLRLKGQPGSADLENLVNRLLASDPLDRPASAHDVARELEHIRQRRISAVDSKRIWQPPVPQNYSTTAGSQVQQQFHVMQQQTASPKRKRLSRRGVIVGLGTGALVLGAGAYVYSRSSGQASSSVQSFTSSANLYIYTRHTSTVTALAWSPDSLRVVSASADGSMQIWQAMNGSRGYTYQGSETITAVAWSPDGSYVTFSRKNGGVGLWDEDRAEVQANLPGYEAIATSLSWDPYQTSPGRLSDHFAAGASDGTIMIRNPASDSIMALIHVYGESVNSIAYSPDGWYLASGATDGRVKIWDMKTYQQIYAVYRGHTASVTSVTWLPNGVNLASASSDQSVSVWSAVSAHTLFTYKGHTGAVNAVSSSPDGHYLASASDDATVQVWSAFDGSLLQDYTGHTAPVTSVSWSPDGNYLASASVDRTVHVWRVPSPPSS